MHKLLALACTLLLSAGACAAPPSDASLDAMFVAMHMDRMLDGIYANMLFGMREGMIQAVPVRHPGEQLRPCLPLRAR